MSNEHTETPRPTGRSRRVRRIAGAVVLAVAAGAGWVAYAAAPERPQAHGPAGIGGPGWWAGDPARIDRMVDRMLGSVDATPEQRTQVKQIVQAAAADLKGQREQGRSLREQSARLFTAPTVDANAVEALRQRMLAQHDQSSRRISQAMLDVSRVLTPEQRVKLAERMKHVADHRGPRGPHREGAPRGLHPEGAPPAGPGPRT